MIFCASPKAQFIPHQDQIVAAVLSVLNSGNYILGEEVAKFEGELAQYLGIEHAVGCGSGTDALVLALRAMGIGRGDEVIVPSHTATATVAAVAMAGATPAFVEIESDFYSLDVGAVEAACTERTKAIIAVHLYGQAADLDRLVTLAGRLGIRLIEDCAQATGAAYRGRKLGTLGDIGCFSFFPTKNMGAFGDGGAVVCRDPALAARVRRLRQYGWDDNRVSLEPGMNSRLDELQAAILRVKLRHLDADNADRRRQASRYREALTGLPVGLPAERDAALHVYHLFVIRTLERDRLLQHLKSKGIAAGVHYATPVHIMPGFSDGTRLPLTEQVVNEIISLPLYPGLDEPSQEQVISAIGGFFGRRPVQ
jgi:dTDP-4-amino-4,6-dideoxygalactose transaminase